MLLLVAEGGNGKADVLLLAGNGYIVLMEAQSNGKGR